MTDANRPLPETPSQTAGPYLHIGLAPRLAGIDGPCAALGSPGAEPDLPGPRIRVSGTITDGAGAPVGDALLEVWQADADGRHAAGGFRGWFRVAPDARTGAFQFETLRPGAVDAPGLAGSAPHLSLWIIARGINTGLATRLYFADAAEANAGDPVLARVPLERRASLMARPGPFGYHFDIRLQGPDETVFFDF
ncbi:protocatechuate 3,4-dioxygenase subunit alpha [Profundibacterium mesophilum]|uniref:Protocatechuate 34-dioxygenase alpha chain n=1 Tax=Profundibacterium mesophilum KAUST100406-0324 TaxID=1037889 RepID=A0A921NXS6_9RHOB|nr:protocatechuate 3,4-dioxygenase subunit alpha [Profundibacterium mesophilum]KAF0676689.1 Protocatechuate 34-dioxygenase alpha chain [Profundibacterium mesophilum KAUST100406-0324]